MEKGKIYIVCDGEQILRWKRGKIFGHGKYIYCREGKEGKYVFEEEKITREYQTDTFCIFCLFTTYAYFAYSPRFA